MLSNKELGSLIKKLRLSKRKSMGKKFTQLNLANELGLSPNHISELESGKRTISFRYLVMISEIMGVSLSYFDDKRNLFYCDENKLL